MKKRNLQGKIKPTMVEYSLKNANLACHLKFNYDKDARERGSLYRRTDLKSHININTKK